MMREISVEHRDLPSLHLGMPDYSAVWRIILEYLSNWLGNTLPVSPRLRLLGDRTWIHSISAGEFSVIMVGITAAARITLRHWNTPKSPAIKEWVNMMTRTASYEHMLNWINDGTRRKAPIWEYGTFSGHSSGYYTDWLTWCMNAVPQYQWPSQSAQTCIYITHLYYVSVYLYLYLDIDICMNSIDLYLLKTAQLTLCL